MTNDYENINEIDLEVSPAALDDDDTFVLNDTEDEISDSISDSDRNYIKNTGIMIDLSDDEDLVSKSSTRTIMANLDDSGINVSKNFKSVSDIDTLTGYNEIDMETDYADDDDYIENDVLDSNRDTDKVVFDNDDLDEAMQGGEVDKNYWKDITKKHRKSIKKGAYNSHFHFSGNPKADREFFNHAMGSNSNDFSEDAIAADSISGNITGVASGESASFGESLDKDKNDFELLDYLGYKITESDGKFIATDIIGNNVEVVGNSVSDILEQLSEVVASCILIPLEAATGNKFKTCKEWVDWYQNNSDDYPELADDIKLCSRISNATNSEINEAMSEADKIEAWHNGTRKINLKACSEDKLRRYYKLCVDLGYADEAEEIISIARDKNLLRDITTELDRVEREQQDAKEKAEREEREYNRPLNIFLRKIEGKSGAATAGMSTEEVDELEHNLYNDLVPSSGKADTIAGEILNAWNYFIYRYINDGDWCFGDCPFGDATSNPASMASYKFVVKNVPQVGWILANTDCNFDQFVSKANRSIINKIFKDKLYEKTNNTNSRSWSEMRHY